LLEMEAWARRGRVGRKVRVGLQQPIRLPQVVARTLSAVSRPVNP